MTSTEKNFSYTGIHHKNRLAVAFALAVSAFIASTTTSLLANRMIAEQTMHTAGEQLRSELQFRKDRLINYLEDVESNLASITSSQIAVNINREFVSALKEDGRTSYTDIRRAYISNNPNPPGRKQALAYANDNSQYSHIHARYHDWLLSFSTAHDYYDLILTDVDGNVVYSVFKEDDFGTNLVNGKYKETELARTFDSIRNNQISTSATFSDFKAYTPSDMLPAAFIGTPIMRDGLFTGALIAQLKHSRLNALIRADTSENNEPRTYLAGDDGYLRSGSGFTSKEILKISSEHQNVNAAMSNRSGVTQTQGFSGTAVVSAFAPLNWNGISWALIVELETDVVEQPLERLRTMLIMAILFCSTLAFLAGWLLADRPDELSEHQYATYQR